MTILGDPLPYYALNTLDYVSILALTKNNEVLLVKQYRPVLDKMTLEMPGGHVEKNQTPEEAASEELMEETGYKAGEMELLGVLSPDVGRLSNKLWCFFTSDITKISNTTVEEGILPTLCNLDKLFQLVKKGKFDFSLQVSILLLAIIKHKINLK